MKGEKLKYFHNDKTGKLRSKSAIHQEELNIFRSILDYRIGQLRKEIHHKNLLLEQPEVEQISLLGDDEKDKNKQMDLLKKQYEKEKVELQKELNRIKSARETLKTHTDIPFVWDISFVEIFEGEKEGFDIVLGNPPYVRQELISDPQEREEDFNSDEWREMKKCYKEKLIKSIYQTYPKFFRYNEKTGKAARKMNAKNDLYVYFYIHGLSLLNNKGSFCFVTSNSWLDVGYGKDLQEFLIRNVPIRMIIDNQVKRTFKSADVNTVICLFGSPAVTQLPHSKTKFVMFKTPFENILNPIIFEEIDEAEDKKSTPEYRIISKSAEELLTAGSETPKTYDIPRYVSYVGDKWGGKYLRAPDIYYTILEKGKDKLVRLGDIAEVRRGFTTGANEFFYLTQEKIDEWGIEEEFLKPVIFSLKELKCIEDDMSNLTRKMFFCHKTKDFLKGTNAIRYIKWGEESIKDENGNEERAFNMRPTCAFRYLWYSIGQSWSAAPFIFPAKVGERMLVLRNTKNIYEDKKLYGITPKNNDNNLLVWSGLLNSTILRFFMDLTCRQLTGAQAIADIDVVVVKELLIPHPKYFNNQNFIEKYIAISKRAIKSKIFEEYNLPDRKALDDVVFDAIGLTQDERKEVYLSVCELVQRRLEKARSV